MNDQQTKKPRRQRPEPEPHEDPSRSLPWDSDAEKGVLSCFLHDPNLIAEMRAILPAEVFYHPANKMLYEVMVELTESKPPKPLDTIGGAGTLSELLNFVPTPAHFGYYCGILKDKLLLRQVINHCNEGIKGAYEYQENGAMELVGKLQRDILTISDDNNQRGPQHCKKAVMEAFDQIDAMTRCVGSVAGLQTGLVDLDRMLNGMENKDRIVIGARPSVGKTSLLMNIAEALSLHQGRPGLIFSLDGDQAALMKRGIAARSGIPLVKFRMGMSSREEMRTLTRSSGEWQKAPLYLDDRPGLSIHQICTAARRLKHSQGIQWIAVDYFQVVTCPDAKAAKDQRIELNIPIILLVQLNREAEKSKGRPKMSDIKECGQVEQDATKIVLLSREDRDWDAIMDPDKGDEDIDMKDRKTAPRLELDELLVVAEVVKNKDGPTGPVWLRFQKNVTRFRSLVPDKPLFSSSHNKEGRELRKVEKGQREQLQPGEFMQAPPED
jgi:replicative DNA helicase